MSAPVDDVKIPGVKNKALKAIALIAGGILLGMTAYALTDKYVFKKFGII